MVSGMNDKAQVEQLKEQEEVRIALKQTTGTKEAAPKPVVKLGDKLWFVTYILVLLGLLALYYFLGSNLFPSGITYITLLRQLTIGAILIVLVIALTKSIRVYLISQIENLPARYN